MSLKVAIDNSTLISAAIRPDSIPDQALQFALHFHELCASIGTLSELESVLKRKHLNRYANPDDRMQFFETVRNNATITAISSAHEEMVCNACRDPKDEKFLALCLSARVDILVSSDQDLLVLNPWNGIPILTPAQFLATVRQ